MTTDMRSLYSQLPAIDHLLRNGAFPTLHESHGHTRVADLLRHILDGARETVRDTHILLTQYEDQVQEASIRLEREPQSVLRPVISLTGTVLHTSSKRTSQVEGAIEAVIQAVRTPVMLEYGLDDAGRGHRNRTLTDLLCRLAGAEDAYIISNSAAAVLLMLAVTANGEEVVVSRGELVEISDAFRIPNVMYQAGCILRKMGTVNRTYAENYHQAVNENIDLLMRVHASNYSIGGFTKSVDETELTVTGQELNVPMVADLGNGSLVDLSRYGLPQEPMPQQLIAAGISLVSLSGGRLPDGPQVGIIVGKEEMVARLQSHPLKRVLRADKMALAALEATLRLYLHPEALAEELPTLRQLTRSQETIYAQVRRLQTQLAEHYDDEFALNMMPCLSQISSGSLPVDRLPGTTLTFTPHDGRRSHLEALAARWHTLPMSVVGRIYDGRLQLDLRYLEDETQLMEMMLK